MDITRRADTQRWTEAEKAISEAIRVVESIGADVRLTDAVILLGAAQDSVADFVDDVRERRRLCHTAAYDIDAQIAARQRRGE